MKRKDLILIVAVAAAALILFLCGNLSREPGDEAVVSVDGTPVLCVPLDTPGVYSVPLEEGRNVIEVKDGAVHMLEADCRDGLCLRQGTIDRLGKQIVCLPHRVIVELKKSEASPVQDDGLDAVVR